MEKQRWDKSQRREEKKEDQRRERVRRKKMQVREKVGKSQNTVFFKWFVAPEGRKVGSLKRRVRSQLARWEMKKCTPLRREAHLEIKMSKAHHSRTTFGSWHVEKVHAVVARSTCRSQKCKKTDKFGTLLEVEMLKKCTPLWREAHVEVKSVKNWQVRDTFGSWDVEKVHAVVARSTFPSQNLQSTARSGHFWKFRCRKSARSCGVKHISKSTLAPCQKWAKREGIAAVSKALAGIEHLKRIWKDAFRVAGALQDMFIRDVRRSGRWFPEMGCVLEHEIFRFAKMILHDRCSTAYDPASLCRGRRNTLETWIGKIAKRIGTRPSALHLAPLLKEVSQNCFVFDVANLRNWG